MLEGVSTSVKGRERVKIDRNDCEADMRNCCWSEQVSSVWVIRPELGLSVDLSSVPCGVVTDYLIPSLPPT